MSPTTLDAMHREKLLEASPTMGESMMSNLARFAYNRSVGPVTSASMEARIMRFERSKQVK